VQPSVRRAADTGAAGRPAGAGHCMVLAARSVLALEAMKRLTLSAAESEQFHGARPMARADAHCMAVTG
jgi:hypothetical protein